MNPATGGMEPIEEEQPVQPDPVREEGDIADIAVEGEVESSNKRPKTPFLAFAQVASSSSLRISAQPFKRQIQVFESQK